MDHGMHESVAPVDIEVEGGNSSSISPPINKKRRGPSQGSKSLPNGETRLILTNRQGQPNLVDENTKALMSDIGLQVHELLPVAYEEFDLIAEKDVVLVIEALMETYNLKYVKASWLDQKMRKAWRDWRYILRRKYIKGKSASEVKAGDTPSFVAIEDWHLFIDISTTPEFLALSARNTANRNKVEIPNASGRHSLAQIRHMVAMENNLESDDDVGRTEAYIAMLSKKCKPDHEKIAEMQHYVTNDPNTRPTGVNDAVSKTFGKDKRGRMRAMGVGVCLDSINNESHLVNKLIDAEQQNMQSESHVHKLSKEMEVFKNFVTNELAKFGKEKLVPSSEHAHSPSSSIRTSQEATNLGRKCDILAWDKRLVARGEVVEVNPEALVHCVKIGNGNCKVLIDIVEDGSAMLFRPNSQVQTIAEAFGSYAVWPKEFLSFYC